MKRKQLLDIYIYVYNIKYDVKEIYKPNSSSGDRLAQSVERLHKWDGRGFDPRTCQWQVNSGAECPQSQNDTGSKPVVV